MVDVEKLNEDVIVDEFTAADEAGSGDEKNASGGSFLAEDDEEDVEDSWADDEDDSLWEDDDEEEDDDEVLQSLASNRVDCHFTTPDIFDMTSILERTKDRCAHCGMKLDDWCSVVPYSILPASLGGKSDYKNQVAMCEHCAKQYSKLGLKLNFKIEFPFMSSRTRIETLQYIEEKLNGGTSDAT